MNRFAIRSRSVPDPANSSAPMAHNQTLAPVPVLYVHYGDQWIRGSENVLLQLFRLIDRSKIRPALWCNGEALAREAESLGVQTIRSDLKHYGMEDSARFNLRSYFAQVSRGRQLVRDLSIRLIHSNSAAPAQWMIPVARSCRIPLLVHIHAHYRRRARLLYGIPFADSIVGVSGYVAEPFLSDGLSPEVVQVIYNGIDVGGLERSAKDHRPVAAPPAPLGALRIGVVASLLRSKGQDTVLRAIQILKRKGIRTFTYFVGEGPERSSYEQLANSLGVAEDISFLGECRPVASFYRDSIDMLVLPTRYEALGLVLLEAACFGVPAIASAVGGVPEVIQEGITGETFEAGNERALALLIEQFSADMPKLRAMGRAARKRIESQFSAERMTREFEGLYEKLLAIPSRRLGWTHNSERLLTCLKLSIPRDAAALRPHTR